MTAAKNANDYANARLNHFFPASSNNTGSDGDLTGQCVSLIKWFLSEMTSVPNPFTARNHAKDYGATLVAQGHATEVKASDRKQGDLVVWPSDGGGFGHIGILLDGDKVFEENVGLEGTPSKTIKSGNESWTVYASRIDPLSAKWRKGNPVFYRIKSYKEGDTDVATIQNKDQAKLLYVMVLHRNLNNVSDKEAQGLVGQDVFKVIDRMRADGAAGAEWHQANGILGTLYPKAKTDLANANKRIKELETSSGVTKASVLDYLAKNLK